MISLLERLEMYVGAGLPVDKALEIGSKGLSHKRAASVADLKDIVRAGGALASGLSRCMGASATTVSLVGHGESSGSLHSGLLSARTLLEKEDELIKKCASAMAYPAVIGIFAVMLTIGLVRGIMPQIIPMLQGLHVRLPLITRAVMWISAAFASYWLYGALVAAGIVIICATAYKRSFGFKKMCHFALTRFIIIGGLSVEYSLAVFLRSCGSLIESGLPSAGAYESTSETIALIPVQRALASHGAAISRGSSISEAFIEKRFPSHISSLLQAGEASGTLGLSMIRAANIIDRDLDHALRRLTALIEPVMMVGMGLVVGAIALSIMMPIYDISKVLQR